MTHFRWVILGLVFLGTTLNYLDRLVMGILAPDLQLRITSAISSTATSSPTFALSYALGQLVAGGLLDRFGTRLGYAVALAAWSVSSMLHAFARGPLSFGVARALLGVSESPAFPAAAKTLAEWFPRRERAFAFGFVNAGTQHGRHSGPGGGAVAGGELWVAVGLRRHRAGWLRLARAVDPALPDSARASARITG